MDLRVDIDRVTFELPGKFTTLDLDGNIYIAGVDEEGKRAFRRQRKQCPFVSFAGCLEDAVINRLNVLEKARNKTSEAAVHGNEAYSCKQETDYNPITFQTAESYLLVQAPELDTFNFSFRFRTYERHGMLLYQELQNHGGADVFLSLESGRVKLQVTYQEPRLPVTLHAGFALQDGLWHSVSVSISGLSATLLVDKDKTSYSSLGMRFSNSRSVIIGATYKHTLGFIGCMYDIKVQGKRVNLTSAISGSRVIRGKCSLKDSCLPNPCKNGGRCTQERNRTICDCSQTDYKGDLCELPAFNYKETCADWRDEGFTRDTFYKINPKGKKPFNTFCRMSDNEGPSTIIDHTRGRNPMIAIQGKLSDESIGRHFYLHSISYETDMENIRALIETSKYCRQYIKYSCQNSVLFDSPKKFDMYGGRGGRWVSHDSQVQDYWGGATPGSEKCACGVNGTCAEANKVCNCDTVDNVWRSDEGYITNSSKLPVNMLMFSVSGTNPHSFYNLGSLECFGSTAHSTDPPLTYISTATTLPPGAKDTSSTASTHTLETTAATSTTSTSDDKNPSTLSSSHTDTSLKEFHTTVRGAGKTSARTSTATKESEKTNTNEVGPTTVAYFNPNPPPVVIIDSPRKYITIKEDTNQELVLIVLSIILAVFIIAIIALIIKQQILFACKCIDTPIYRDVQHANSIELGSSPVYGHNEPEILQYETSPYPPRDYELEFSRGGMAIISPRVMRLGGRSFHLTQSESDTDTDTDRLDVSNDSSITSASSCNTNGCPNEKLKPIAEVEESDKSVETSPLKSSTPFRVDAQIEKLKDVIFDVISSNEYRLDKTFEEKNITKDKNQKGCRNLKRKLALSSSVCEVVGGSSDQGSTTSLTRRTCSCDKDSEDEDDTETSSFVNSPRSKNSLCQDPFCNNNKNNSKESVDVYLSFDDTSQDPTYLRENQIRSTCNPSRTLKTDSCPLRDNRYTKKQKFHYPQSKNIQDVDRSENHDIVLVNPYYPEDGRDTVCSLSDARTESTLENDRTCSTNESNNTKRDAQLISRRQDFAYISKSIDSKQQDPTYVSHCSLEIGSEDDAFVCNRYETEI